MIARVPSGDSPFGRAIQYGDLSHRLVLGSSAVKQLALDTGLAVVSTRSPAFPIRGMGLVTSVRRTLVQIAQQISHKIITLALMGGGGPVLTTTMIFVLRRP